MRRPLRMLALPLVVLAALAPAADAASKKKEKTTTQSAPVVTAPQPAPQPAPGGAFGPIQPLAGGDTETTQTSVNTKRPGETGLGRGTLLLLTVVSFTLILGVGGVIWYEGRGRRSADKKRRQRMRSGRTPQAQAAGAQGRRGPPPPPRKRRAQAAKRRKR